MLAYISTLTFGDAGVEDGTMCDIPRTFVLMLQAPPVVLPAVLPVVLKVVLMVVLPMVLPAVLPVPQLVLPPPVLPAATLVVLPLVPVAARNGARVDLGDAASGQVPAASGDDDWPKTDPNPY